MSIYRERIVAVGEAVTAARQWELKLPRQPVALATREVHAALVKSKAFADDLQKKAGWKLLAKLADYEFPGVRRGAETESAWRGLKRMVRPLEWHHIPTAEEMAEWVEKVRTRKPDGELESLSREVSDLRAKVEALEEQMRNLLASPAAPVAQ